MRENREGLQFLRALASSQKQNVRQQMRHGKNDLQQRHQRRDKHALQITPPYAATVTYHLRLDTG
jgi:hypothetical protein